jgi:aminoglycoside 6-adenylyltransferase
MAPGQTRRRDIFHDFDIVYLVTDVNSFKNNRAWIERFGPIMILQMPDDMQDPPPSDNGAFAYLMQFTDGNQLDLTLYPVARSGSLARDSLSILLLDKDGIIPPFPPPSDDAYLPKPPTPKAYADCCNEFWWVCTCVAKGLWREETTYAKFFLEQAVRPQLMKMLTWHIGVRTGFSCNPGYLGRHFRQFLEPDLWEKLRDTYSDADVSNSWEALYAMCGLFRASAIPVAEHFRFVYQSMREMIFGEPASFDHMIEVLREIEDAVNAA